MDPMVDHDKKDQQEIFSQKEKNRPPTPVVDGSDQESACSHPKSSTIAGLVQDNAMTEVFETVLDKRLSTDEDSIGSGLCVLKHL